MIDDIRAAFSFLTIIPLGASGARKPGWSFAWYPLVGVCIGALLVGIASRAPFSPNLNAFLVLLCWVIIAGGLHLDGFGDSCDSLLATRTPEDRLAIMKDPRAGAWAVLGLVLLMLGKWLTIRELDAVQLLLPPVCGRWAMVIAAYYFPLARPNGAAAHFRAGLGRKQLLIASATVGIVVLNFTGIHLWLLTAGLTLLCGHWAARRLGGGITGDVYGAICELTEMACLLAIGIFYG